jgi:hypothetical protein
VGLLYSDYVNLPADPRHKQQLNGFSGTNEADTPTILTTFLGPIGRFPQFNRATARISYRNFGLMAASFAVGVAALPVMVVLTWLKSNRPKSHDPSSIS